MAVYPMQSDWQFAHAKVVVMFTHFRCDCICFIKLLPQQRGLMNSISSSLMGIPNHRIHLLNDIMLLLFCAEWSNGPTKLEHCKISILCALCYWTILYSSVWQHKHCAGIWTGHVYHNYTIGIATPSQMDATVIPDSQHDGHSLSTDNSQVAKTIAATSNVHRSTFSHHIDI